MARYDLGLATIVTATAVALASSAGVMAQTQEQPADTQTQAGQEQTDEKLERAKQQLEEGDQSAGQQAGEDQPATEEAEQQTADEQAPSAPEGPFIAEQEEGTLLASELQGLTIVGADGEEIGAIEDLILHPEGGIFGATVSVGGFLGMGGKEVALSWKRFDYSLEEQLARVDATREELEEAPDFTTLSEMRAEQEAAAAEQRMQQQQGATGTAPQPSTGTQ